MIPKELEKLRDKKAYDYDMNFEFTGSYSSIDMDDTYKIGYDQAVKDTIAMVMGTLEMVERNIKSCTTREPAYRETVDLIKRLNNE